MDGSTDASNKEKELIFILCVDPDTGKQRLRVFSLRKVECATAAGVLATIKNAFQDHNIDSLKEHTVGLGADDAAVNFGVKGGVATLLKKDEGIDWLVPVHCVSHKLELSITDALKSTLFSEINKMLVKVYYLYKNSPKKMRQLTGLGQALEMAVSTPVKANGTRWLEDKLRALNWISKNYGLLMTHLSHLTEDTTYPSAE